MLRAKAPTTGSDKPYKTYDQEYRGAQCWILVSSNLESYRMPLVIRRQSPSPGRRNVGTKPLAFIVPYLSLPHKPTGSQTTTDLWFLGLSRTERFQTLCKLCQLSHESSNKQATIQGSLVPTIQTRPSKHDLGWEKHVVSGYSTSVYGRMSIFPSYISWMFHQYSCWRCLILVNNAIMTHDGSISSVKTAGQLGLLRSKILGHPTT